MIFDTSIHCLYCVLLCVCVLTVMDNEWILFPDSVLLSCLISVELFACDG